MSQIQIICSKPGIRRNGIENPASAIYPADRWTPEQLQAFKADPAFIVQEVGSGGVKLTGVDFDTAVAAEVQKQVEGITSALQTSFNAKVAEAATERVANLQADHDNALDALGKKLEAAEAEILILKAAPAPAPTTAPVSDASGTEPVAEPEKAKTAPKK
ncbi:hypothetical protein GGQ73_003186 [Rhizobium skierniewicense]|uniref:Mu-like prophage FluMu N-terminal domain-containing protein n=1 Tax=Rhizobium skierniewicense TaxID=984260 RepID=A0A7W6CEQ9_9HYPH|nr:hypothetical protein [Rhizobium skierniewicense]MBB3947220.1 hypothetical protein [Rhizobium skierniewicense]